MMAWYNGYGGATVAGAANGQSLHDRYRANGDVTLKSIPIFCGGGEYYWGVSVAPNNRKPFFYCADGGAGVPSAATVLLMSRDVFIPSGATYLYAQLRCRLSDTTDQFWSTVIGAGIPTLGLRVDVTGSAGILRYGNLTLSTTMFDGEVWTDPVSPSIALAGWGQQILTISVQNGMLVQMQGNVYVTGIRCWVDMT